MTRDTQNLTAEQVQHIAGMSDAELGIPSALPPQPAIQVPEGVKPDEYVKALSYLQDQAREAHIKAVQERASANVAQLAATEREMRQHKPLASDPSKGYLALYGRLEIAMRDLGLAVGAGGVVRNPGSNRLGWTDGQVAADVITLAVDLAQAVSRQFPER